MMCKIIFHHHHHHENYVMNETDSCQQHSSFLRKLVCTHLLYLILKSVNSTSTDSLLKNFTPKKKKNEKKKLKPKIPNNLL